MLNHTCSVAVGQFRIFNQLHQYTLCCSVVTSVYLDIMCPLNFHPGLKSFILTLTSTCCGRGVGVVDTVIQFACLFWTRRF